MTMTEGIRLAGRKDIAAMKLAAITGRGSKKDFIDVFFTKGISPGGNDQFL
jgi:hypothetical protein